MHLDIGGGKQKTYGRFFGMIFREEVQPLHPPQGKEITAAKTLKNRKTTKNSSFFFGQKPSISALSRVKTTEILSCPQCNQFW
jgi:hypothetical protein